MTNCGVTKTTNIIKVVSYIWKDINKYVWGDFKIDELYNLLLLFFILLHTYNSKGKIITFYIYHISSCLNFFIILIIFLLGYEDNYVESIIILPLFLI